MVRSFHRTKAAAALFPPPDVSASTTAVFSSHILLQALLSLIDLKYHGQVLPQDQGGSSSVWHQLAQQYSSIPPPPDTCPQARFSHLTIYGACYYSYLYARCISEALWNVHLAADPLNPEAGVWVRCGWLGCSGWGQHVLA